MGPILPDLLLITWYGPYIWVWRVDTSPYIRVQRTSFLWWGVLDLLYLGDGALYLISVLLILGHPLYTRMAYPLILGGPFYGPPQGMVDRWCAEGWTLLGYLIWSTFFLGAYYMWTLIYCTRARGR